jgi:outer membrane immunogenic protein
MSVKIKIIRSAMLAAAFAAASVPAMAADVVDEIPAPAVPMEVPPVASWTGIYAGVVAGYGFAGRSEVDGLDATVDTDGFVGGGFLGYNYDTGGGIVAGVEGDIGYSGIDGDEDGVRVRNGVDGSLRARLGYTITPDALVYATAGGAAKQMEVRQGGEEDSATQLGWTAGVGTDIKITGNVFGRAEYRYTDYGKADFNLGAGNHSVDSSDHRVLFGVGMQF